MTIPRSQLISYDVTLFYHIISRCVRHNYLCGIDPNTQKNCDHRKQWIEDRIRILSSLFSIEICSYTVLSNHFHIVLKAVPDEANTWSDRDVARRWLSLFRGTDVAKRFCKGDKLKSDEKEVVKRLIRTWRERLTSISWFMKSLNEPIARQANKEDGKEGNFWISRFKSEALLDEEAVLTAMAYVDLNYVRAGVAETPESSPHTSIKERLYPQFNLSKAVKSYCEHGGFSDHLTSDKNPIPIRALAAIKDGGYKEASHNEINFSLKDYLELVDYSGRAIRDDKVGYIDQLQPPIIDRLGIASQIWFENCQHFETLYQERFSAEVLFSK